MRNPDRVQINPRISRDNRNKLRLHVIARGDTTEGAIVDAALTAYFESAYDSVRIQRRLDRLTRQSGRLERNLGFLSELVAAYIKLWLGHTPELPESAKPAAERAAKPRYERLLDYVGEHLAGGRTALAQAFSEDEPSAAAASAPVAAPPPDPPAT